MNFPRMVPAPCETDMVQIIVSEKLAREIERQFLAPNLELVGPLLFDDEDLPCYTVVPR